MRHSLHRRAAITAASLVLVGTAQPASAIVGGQVGPSPGSQINYIAAISIPQIPVGQYFCAGVLIRPTTVLSVARCLPPSTSGPGAQIRVGSQHRSTGGTLVAATGFVKHPTADLMLVRLAAPVPEQPVPFRDTEAPVGTGVAIVGWGSTSLGNDRPDNYHTAFTDISSPESCMDTTNSVSVDLCVNNLKGVGPCKGDEGGPVIEHAVGSTSQHRLVGVIRTVECGAKPSIAVDVPLLRAWIDQNSR